MLLNPELGILMVTTLSQQRKETNWLAKDKLLCPKMVYVPLASG